MLNRRRISALVLLYAVIAAGPAAAGIAGDTRKEAFRALNDGVAAYNRGEYVVAAEHLEACAAVSLNSFRAHYFLGLALNAARRYDRAIEALTVALDLDPNHLMSLIASGDAWLKLGDVDEARAAYFRALKVRAAFAPALDGLARVEEARARDDEAIESFRQALLSDKGYAPAYTHLGNLYLRQGRMREAVRLLEEAVTIRPDYAPGLNRLGIAYGHLGMENQAVAAVQRAIELEPTNPEHPAALGELQLSAGAVSLADASFRRSLSLDQRIPEAHLGLAELARRRGDYESALASLDEAADAAHLSLGLDRRVDDLRARIEDEATSLERLRARVEADDATPDVWDELARYAAGRGEWMLAAEYQTRGSDSPEARELLAYFLFREGRYREAESAWRLLAASGRAESTFNRAVALARLGDDAGAAEAFRASIESDPSRARAHAYLANALLRQGFQDQAIDSYAAFLASGAVGSEAEQVRRILEQLAPERIPNDGANNAPLLPDAPPPAEDNLEETDE